MTSLAIGLADDHPMMRDAIARFLACSLDCRLVAIGMTKDIHNIAVRDQPDIIIVDPGDSVIAYRAMATTVRTLPHTKFIVFSGTSSVGCAVFALEAGACGFLTKVSGGKELLVAIEAVRNGETYITERFASDVIAALRDSSIRKAAAQAAHLSRREAQVIKLLLSGTTNKEIGSRLGIGEKTVKNYMTALMQKLNARNRVELVIAAQKLGEGGTGDIRSAPARFM
jgi:DNA-binding NarL/FixJ family response regulator